MNECSFILWHHAVVVANKKSSRTVARAARRRQLIEATIKCISRKGLGGTTLSDVAGAAGLSQGIVNLHFDSKDNLLNETLRYVAEDYKSQFQKVVEKSGPSAAEKLLALVEMDLRPSICDRRKLAVWFAFWGEVKTVPTYRKICAAYDQHYDEVMNGLVAEIIEEGDYQRITPQLVTDALSSMTDGLWLSCLISPESWDRHAARDAVLGYLRGVFPKHFK